jgi:dihydrofolate reductase
MPGSGETRPNPVFCAMPTRTDHTSAAAEAARTSEAFTHGGWQAPFPDRAVGEFVTELNSHASAFLLGRRTFDIFRGYWPDQTDPANPIATAINALPKYVLRR